MGKRNLTIACQFLPYYRARRETPPVGELWIDVSSTAELPYNQFSPFYPHGGIPIPGMTGKFSDSVEGIWQGLKVIRGKTAPRYFSGGGSKRGGKPAGHQYGTQKKLLKLVEARQKIYVVAYEWMLENCIDRELIDEILDRSRAGEPQLFYDREDNASIGKDEPLAHAALLVRYLNRLLEK